MTVVCFGDSITAGQHLDPELAWPALLGWEARGVPGETTRQALERFPRDVQESGAAKVVIQFGLNDCNRWETDRGLSRVSEAAFEANLVEMVERARRFEIEPALVTITPTLKGVEYEEAAEAYTQTIVWLADELTVPIYDVRDELEHLPLDELLLPDGVHLSAEGHRFYAEILRPFGEL